jgi:hypothetical protein
MAETLRWLEALYQGVVQRYRDGTVPKLDELTRRVSEAVQGYDDLLKQAAYEPGMPELGEAGLAVVRGRLMQIWWAIEALELATRGGPNGTYHRRFEPELGELLKAISTTFHRLAENIATVQGNADSADLDDALSAVDHKVTAVRATGVSTSYSLEEVSRFYAFLIGVKSLVKALEWSGDRQLPGARP